MMWMTEHTAEADVSVDRIWGALRDRLTGASTSPDGDTFEMHGPFQVGSELSVTPQGQETFRSRIIELVDGERYADRTQFGELTLVFRHLMNPTESGTTVTHQLVIDGPQADLVGPELGPQISADFPDAMQSLFAAAARP